jgi:hypothetical protein
VTDSDRNVVLGREKTIPEMSTAMLFFSAHPDRESATRVALPGMPAARPALSSGRLLLSWIRLICVCINCATQWMSSRIHEYSSHQPIPVDYFFKRLGHMNKLCLGFSRESMTQNPAKGPILLFIFFLF